MSITSSCTVCLLFTIILIDFFEIKSSVMKTKACRHVEEDVTLPVYCLPLSIILNKAAVVVRIAAG